MRRVEYAQAAARAAALHALSTGSQAPAVAVNDSSTASSNASSSSSSSSLKRAAPEPSLALDDDGDVITVTNNHSSDHHQHHQQQGDQEEDSEHDGLNMLLPRARKRRKQASRTSSLLSPPPPQPPGNNNDADDDDDDAKLAALKSTIIAAAASAASSSSPRSRQRAARMRRFHERFIQGLGNSSCVLVLRDDCEGLPPLAHKVSVEDDVVDGVVVVDGLSQVDTDAWVVDGVSQPQVFALVMHGGGTRVLRQRASLLSVPDMIQNRRSVVLRFAIEADAGDAGDLLRPCAAQDEPEMVAYLVVASKTTQLSKRSNSDLAESDDSDSDSDSDSDDSEDEESSDHQFRRALLLRLDLAVSEDVYERLGLQQRRQLRKCLDHFKQDLAVNMVKRNYEGKTTVPLGWMQSHSSAAFRLDTQTAPVDVDGVVHERTDFSFPSVEQVPPSFNIATHALRTGVSVHKGIFSPLELALVEHSVNELVAHAGELMFAHTAQASSAHRTKFFFGSRYLWTRAELARRDSHVAAGVRTDVDPIPEWLQPVIRRLEARGIVPCNWVNAVAINVYHNGTLGIGQHMDDAKRFDRPIVSLRVHSPARLSFGAKMQGQSDPEFCVPMPRGAVTVLQPNSFAADEIKHSVRACDMVGKSTAIIFRRVHPNVLEQAITLERHLRAAKARKAARSSRRHGATKKRKQLLGDSDSDSSDSDSDSEISDVSDVSDDDSSDVPELSDSSTASSSSSSDEEVEETPKKKVKKKQPAPKKKQKKQQQKKKGAKETESFVVEGILEKSTTKKWGTLYLVKWLGFPDSDATWQAAEDFADQAFLEAFEKQIGRVKNWKRS